MNTKANIIIIEDEKNICNFIETVLSPQGYQVTCANTGTDGLKLIESLKPDVVLLDLGLPDMDGLELIQEVRSTSALPIQDPGAQQGGCPGPGSRRLPHQTLWHG